jgi:hypothetical protein
MKNKIDIPDILKKVGFDFSWDERKVWLLEVPTEEMKIMELEWHLVIPFWKSYTLKPIQVQRAPSVFKEEYERTMESDLHYPIDIMFWKRRWLILDGLHRLLKSKILGYEIIRVRKIDKQFIPQISE